jgi:hypothetical protein
MAGQFQAVLAASDLSKRLILCVGYHILNSLSARFVPFAIFVCSASLLIILVLWVHVSQTTAVA